MAILQAQLTIEDTFERHSGKAVDEKSLKHCEGGCHCGAVRFRIEVPASVVVHQCNCSICQKSGYLHLIVAAQHFELLQGADHLVDYQFNTGVAHHLFCRTCGIKSYYVPRSHPDGFSVNLNCVEIPEWLEVEIEPFDGQNWSKNRSVFD